MKVGYAALCQNGMITELLISNNPINIKNIYKNYGEFEDTKIP